MISTGIKESLHPRFIRSRHRRPLRRLTAIVSFGKITVQLIDADLNYRSTELIHSAA